MNKEGYINESSDFKILFENAVMILGHHFESAYVYNKITKEELGIFEFDYDPVCGLVGVNNDWFLVGGEVLVLKTWADRTLRFIGDLHYIHELRLINEYTVHVLTDPWAEASAIWQLEIDLNKLTNPVNLFKVKDFKDYINKPYTDNVVW